MGWDGNSQMTSTDFQRRRQYDGKHLFDVATNDSIQPVDSLSRERITSRAGALENIMTDNGNDIPFAAIERMTRYYCSDDVPSKSSQRQHNNKQAPKDRTNKRRKDRVYSNQHEFDEYDSLVHHRHNQSYNNPESVSARSPSEWTTSLPGRRNENDTNTSTQSSEPFLKGRKPDFGDISVADNQASLLHRMMKSPSIQRMLRQEEEKERERHQRQLEMYDKMLAPGLAETVGPNFSDASNWSNPHSQLTPLTCELNSNGRNDTPQMSSESESFQDDFEMIDDNGQLKHHGRNKESSFSRSDSDLRLKNRRGSVGNGFYLNDSNQKSWSRNSFTMDDNSRQMITRNASQNNDFSMSGSKRQLSSRNGSHGNDVSMRDGNWHVSNRGRSGGMNDDNNPTPSNRRVSLTGYNNTNSMQHSPRARPSGGERHSFGSSKGSGGSSENRQRGSPSNSRTNERRRSPQILPNQTRQFNPVENHKVGRRRSMEAVQHKEDYWHEIPTDVDRYQHHEDRGDDRGEVFHIHGDYLNEVGRSPDRNRLYNEDEKFHIQDQMQEEDDRRQVYDLYDDEDGRFRIPQNVINDSLWKQIENRSNKLNATNIPKDSEEAALAAAFNFFSMNVVDRELLGAAVEGYYDDRLGTRPPQRIETVHEHDDSVSGVTTPTQLEIPTAVFSRKKNDSKKKKVGNIGSNSAPGMQFPPAESHNVSPGDGSGRRSRHMSDHRKKFNVPERDEMTSISSIATSVDYYISGGYSSYGRRRRSDFHDSSEAIIKEEEAYVDEQFDTFRMDDHRRHDDGMEHPSWDDYDAPDSFLLSSYSELETQLDSNGKTGAVPYDDDDEPFLQSPRNREDEDDDSLFLNKELEQSLLRQLQLKKSRGNVSNKGNSTKTTKSAKEQRSPVVQRATSSTTSPKSLQQRLDKHFTSRKSMVSKKKSKQKQDAKKQNIQYSFEFGEIDPKSQSSASDDEGMEDEQFVLCCESASDFVSYQNWNDTPPDAIPFKTFRTSDCTVVSELTKAHFGDDEDDNEGSDPRPEEASVKHSLRSLPVHQKVYVKRELHNDIVPTQQKRKGSRPTTRKVLRWRDGGDSKNGVKNVSSEAEEPLESILEFSKQVDETCRIVIILLKTEKDFQEMLDATAKNNDGASTMTNNPAMEYEYLHCDFKTQQRMKVRDILIQLPSLLKIQREQRRRQQDKVEKYMSMTGNYSVSTSPKRDIVETYETYKSLYMLGSELINVLSLQDYFCAESDESECLLRDGLIFFAVPDYLKNDIEDSSKRSELLHKKRLKQQLTYASIILTTSIRKTLVAGRDLHHLKSSSELEQGDSETIDF